jgi:hypothetical protein
VEDIPCVLGAAYACSRQYWQYLKGLSGIISRFLSLWKENSKPEKSIRLNQIITLPYYFDNKFETQPLGLKFGYAGVGIRKMRIT